MSPPPATVEEAVLNGEPLYEMHVPYTQDGESDQFSVVLPETFALNESKATELALERAEEYLDEDADITDGPSDPAKVPDTMKDKALEA